MALGDMLPKHRYRAFAGRSIATTQAAPKHWAHTTGPKNERRHGRLADMPLGFLPKDFIQTLTRPNSL